MTDKDKILKKIKTIEILSVLLSESIKENASYGEYAYIRSNASRNAIKDQIKILRYELLALSKEL